MPSTQRNPNQHLQDEQKDVQRRLRNLERPYDSGWIALSLINSWSGSLSYRIIGRELRLNGVVSGGATGNAIAQLPAEAYPRGDGGKVGVVSEHSGTINSGYVNVPGSGGSAGQVIPTFSTAGSTLSIAGFTLLIN